MFEDRDLLGNHVTSAPLPRADIDPFDERPRYGGVRNDVMMTTTNPAAITVASDSIENFRRDLEPSDIVAAFQLAEAVAKTGMCGITKPEDALVRIMTGRELGLSAMQSLRGVYVVEGRPSLDASLMMALAMRHPDCERFEFVETTTTRATLVVKRRNRSEIKITWTIEDAARAGLVKPKGAWEKSPAQMLRARCKSDACRLEFSDALFGLYSREELNDGVVVDEPAPRITAAVQAADSMKVQQASSRFEQIAHGFLQRIADATTADDAKRLRADVRRAMNEGELVVPWSDRVLAAYTNKWPGNRAGATQATPQQVDAQGVVTTPSSSSDVGGGSP